MPNWLSRKLNSPLRQSGGTPSGYNDQYGGVAPQSAYDMPGYQQRAGELSGFAKDRGGGPFRGQQEELSNMLMAQARGEQSYSAEQLRQNAGRMQSMQQSMAAGARPSQSAMANRMAMQGASRIGTDMIGQQALAGIAERNAAAQSLGGVLQGARGQDIDAYLGAQGLGLQNAAGQQAGQLGREQIRANRYGTAMGSPSNKEALIGALTGVGAGLGKVLSDDKSKVGIRSAGRDVDKLMAALPEPSKYNYRGGPQPVPYPQEVGMVAQEVEKVAPGAVSNTPAGKAVDGGKMAVMALAGASRANKKLDALAEMIMAKNAKNKMPANWSEMAQGKLTPLRGDIESAVGYEALPMLVTSLAEEGEDAGQFRGTRVAPSRDREASRFRRVPKESMNWDSIQAEMQALDRARRARRGK